MSYNSFFKPALLLCSALICLTTSGQHYNTYSDRTGRVIAAELMEDGVITKYLREKDNQDKWLIEGKHFTLEVRDKVGEGAHRANPDSLAWIEPGILPEGDMVQDIEFSPEGDVYAVVYRMSHNVFVYDALTDEILHILPAGTGPVDVDFTANHMYVCASISNDLYDYNRSDYSLNYIYSLAGSPSQVEATADEMYIAIGFPTYMDGYIKVYNTADHSLMYTLNDPFIHHYGYYGNPGRKSYRYYRFDLSPDGDWLACMHDDGFPVIYDITTGYEAYIRYDRGFMAYSASNEGDTTFLLTTNSTGTEIIAYRLQSGTFSVIDSIVRAADFLIAPFELAVSADGSKALTVDEWNDETILFDFNSHTTSQFGVPSLFLTTLRQCNDRNYVYMFTDMGVSIFNFNLPGYTSSNGEMALITGAVSPDGNKAIYPQSFDYFSNYSNSNEKLSTKNCSNRNNIVNDSIIIAGVLPEADLTTGACLTAEGGKLVAANFISANYSIIDKTTGELESINPVSQVVKVTAVPGSPYVVLSGQYPNPILLNAVTNTIEAQFTTGSSWSVIASPKGDYIYVMNNDGWLFKIRIDGANSHVESSVIVAFGRHFYQLGATEVQLYTTFGLSPDGKTLLVTGNDPAQGYRMQIIDTEAMQVIKAIPITNPNTYSYAFTNDGKRVFVSCLSDYAWIFYINGEDSYLENTVMTDNNYSAGYNKINNKFYAGAYSRLDEVNVYTGQTSIVSYFSDEYILDIASDPFGELLYRTEYNLYHGNTALPLPGPSGGFAYDTVNQVVVIPTLGPDCIVTYSPLTTQVEYLSPSGSVLKIYPNPAAREVTIELTDENNHLSIFNSLGNCVISKEHGRGLCKILVDRLPGGVYLVQNRTEKGISTGKLLVKK